jgi:hypothetical protein
MQVPRGSVGRRAAFRSAAMSCPKCSARMMSVLSGRWTPCCSKEPMGSRAIPLVLRCQSGEVAVGREEWMAGLSG